MDEGKLSLNRNSLLHYAVSRLTPEVFLHPVWVRFGKKELSASLTAVDDLFSTAKRLQKDEPGIACQILLACAVYQNHAGQGFNALRTIQEALALSQSNNLTQEAAWSLWGICAILIQQGNHEKACTHLVDLQATLSEQNEWILADFVDVFRQALAHPGMIHTKKYPIISRDPTYEETIGFTFNWLHHWGFPFQSFENENFIDHDRTQNHSSNLPAVSESLTHHQPWKDVWHTLLAAIKNQLIFNWAEKNTQKPKITLHVIRYFVSRGYSYLFHRSFSSQTSDSLSFVKNKDIPLPVTDHSPPQPPQAKEMASVEKSVANKEMWVEKGSTHILVAVHMLGIFSMTIGGLSIKFPASRGLSLLKYLLVHRKQHITREILMDIFWPDVEPETARNNLNVAIHSLRKILRKAIFLPVILYQDGGYIFDPALQIWLDVEEYIRCVQEGQRLEERNQITAAMREYEAAVSLYQGDFLEQNPYEEWTILDRERLRITYLDTLDRLGQIYFKQEQYAACIAVCQLILTHDHCREDAHCLLMRCYSHQGQYHLAIRQYQVCVELLRAELDVEPASQTRKLYEQIRRENAQ